MRCALQNQFDSMDLSDNNVIILEGFPKLPRLKVLLLNNNRITRIGRHLEGARIHALWSCLVHHSPIAAKATVARWQVAGGLISIMCMRCRPQSPSPT